MANGSLRAVNSVGLEGYLFGVVPSEMPNTWLPEALKAQAVAARSYALAVRKTNSWFDLYADTRSQVYLGIAHEKPSTTAAVQATAGQVVLYEGRVATTYFYSSSGGRTAAANDVWQGPPVPYLVSVDDPYDTISPYHRWGPFTVTAGRLDQVLRAPGRLMDVRMVKSPSGYVRTVTAVGSEGEATATGSEVRRALDLRSSWFRVGVLSLATPDAPVTFGGRVSLSGVARSLPAVQLEQREGREAWRALGHVARGPNGSVTVAARPKATTDYRLASGSARSRLAHVAVAPLVRFRGVKNASLCAASPVPCSGGAGRRATAGREQVDDGRARSDRRDRPLRRTVHAGPGRLPRAARSRPWLRSRCQPHAPGGTGMRRLALAVFLVALAIPAQAGAARYAVGLQKGVSPNLVAQRIEAGAPVAVCRRSRPSRSPSTRLARKTSAPPR